MGAVAPSSPALARRMAESGEVWKAGHVLELGPGTGSLTAAVADSMPHGAKYLGIELNPEYCETAKTRIQQTKEELYLGSKNQP